MAVLFLDTETRSPVPLDRGLARYATGVEVIIVTWAMDDEDVQTWDATRGGAIPEDLMLAADLCDRVVAHNAAFDRTVIERSLPELAALLAGKWYCTMAMAFRHGLPGGLDKLSTVFRLPENKAKHDGKEGIHLFCKPRKDGSWATRNTHPAEWAKFLKYAASDIRAMRVIYGKCPKWNDTAHELALWRLDQVINERGIAVDEAFAREAYRAALEEQKRLGDRTEELTDGNVLRTTQRDQLLAFLFAEHGVALPDLKADTVERRLNDPELPEHAKEVLRIRQQASKSSTTKYRRLLESQVAGRLYYLLQYCAAYRTGRWGGRLFQPQNLPRPSLKWPRILEAIDAVLAGAETLVIDDIMEALSSCLRSVLIAAPGKKLVVSDLSNIEGRKLAWLAGEQWKLDAFAAFDAGIGPDMYKAAYGRLFDIDPFTITDDSDARQVGKVLELSMGYQGGVGAFVSMAAVYGMDLDELAEKARRTIPRETWLDAEQTYEWAKRHHRTLGLSKEVYTVCEALKRLWREAHPAIVQFWADCENAFKAAVLNEGVQYPAGRVMIDRKGAWLRARLPSGRYLLYPNPRIESDGSITFGAWNVYTKSWRREPTYGGKLAENFTQASSRDVMADAMLRAEPAGYALVLSVHDELVSETLDDERFNAAELIRIMATNPPWAEGLPLAAKGFESYRYRKS